MKMTGRKIFFSEEKKQKTFIFWSGVARKGTQGTKVFWFFFSKKNGLLILPSALGAGLAMRPNRHFLKPRS